VYVGKLDENVTEEHIRRVFEANGKIRGIQLHPTGRYCFVQFETTAGRDAALIAHDGEGNNRNFHVRRRQRQIRRRGVDRKRPNTREKDLRNDGHEKRDGGEGRRHRERNEGGGRDETRERGGIRERGGRRDRDKDGERDGGRDKGRVRERRDRGNNGRDRKSTQRSREFFPLPRTWRKKIPPTQTTPNPSNPEAASNR